MEPLGDKSIEVVVAKWRKVECAVYLRSNVETFFPVVLFECGISDSSTLTCWVMKTFFDEGL